MVLGPDSVGMMKAIVPVVLAGSLPADAAARNAAVDQVIEAFDRAITGLSPAVQAEIGELLDVLRYAPTRVALAGITGSWAHASPESIAAFLQRWRTSRFDLLRSGYQALTQLIQAAWYDNPLAWKAIGYPGPPALVAPRGS